MWTGGCLCGLVRFQCAEVGPINYCHCTDCRRSSGGAFNVGVRVPAAAFTISGPTTAYTKQGDSGAELTRRFCAECGSPIFTSSAKHADVVFVKAGAFDEPDLPAASHESWTRSKVAWADIPADIAHFDKGRTP